MDNISSAELADVNYPFIMTTGRVLYQYHTMTMTGRVEELNKKVPESYIEMNTATVERLGLNDGDKVRVKGGCCKCRKSRVRVRRLELKIEN